ncbi:hypothetical protein D9619_012064 [Psilocybe cf. subviscida]|uniref:Uncharacterized protein n=1 Tax=Psilocybe cf. subviscida TaxID=2480587 RepID=A0A8H5EZG3_9AGAR|nr:hypothetical protein D9619_012064 [Psilocybe cf. subviscida]
MDEDCSFDIRVIGTEFATTFVLISATAYGMNVVLLASCLYFLNSGPYAHSRPKIIGFHLYILAMIALATQAAVNISQFASDAGFHLMLGLNIDCLSSSGVASDALPPKRYQQVSAISIPFTILGADAFMLWRCFILYQGTAKFKRVVTTLVLGVLATASIASAIWFIYSFFHQDGVVTLFVSPVSSEDSVTKSRSIIALLVATAISNFSTSVLISTRLLYAHRLLGDAP